MDGQADGQTDPSSIYKSMSLPYVINNLWPSGWLWNHYKAYWLCQQGVKHTDWSNVFFKSLLLKKGEFYVHFYLGNLFDNYNCFFTSFNF